MRDISIISKYHTQSLRELMYDDYEINCSFNNEFYAYDLDEMCENHYHMHTNHMQPRDMHEGYEYDDDDDYARDSCDYDALAYRHYA